MGAKLLVYRWRGWQKKLSSGVFEIFWGGWQTIRPSRGGMFIDFAWRGSYGMRKLETLWPVMASEVDPTGWRNVWKSTNYAGTWSVLIAVSWVGAGRVRSEVRRGLFFVCFHLSLGHLSLQEFTAIVANLRVTCTRRIVRSSAEAKAVQCFELRLSFLRKNLPSNRFVPCVTTTLKIFHRQLWSVCGCPWLFV